MALNANTTWEIRTDGNSVNGGGFRWLSLRSATYKWTASGSGTNEYYCEAAAGGDPSLTEAKCCSLSGAFMLATNGTMGSLNASEWDWGDNDSLGYSTVYVRLADGADPDSKAPGFVQIGNGGGYDYSQQAAAQLALTDIYFTSGTTIKSDTGGFTPLMVGNIICIPSGDHFTPKWYEIATYVSTNEVTLDSAPASEDTSAHKNAVGNVGGAWEFGTTWDDNFFEAKVAGNTVYIKSGTHAEIGETVNSSVSGTVTQPIRVVGYDTARSSRPTGDNRPLIQCGVSYYFGASGSFIIIENLRFTGSASYVVNCLGSSESVLNCKATNNSATANRSAFFGLTVVYFIGCEGISTNGYAFNGGCLIHCYAHDSVSGFIGASHTLFCIADTCSTYGISQASGITMNCTAYNCGTNLYLSAATALSVVINNILDAGTTGIDASAAKESTILAFNSFDNTSDLAANVNGSIQIENQTGDPGLGDPANADFRITSADTLVYQLGLDVQTYTPAVVG